MRTGAEESRRRLSWPPRNFTLQTFLHLASCIVFATVLLSALLIHFQQAMLRRHILESGTRVVSFLAESLRIGLFSENAEEIRAAMLPVLQDPQVVEVGVFDPQWKTVQLGRASLERLPETGQAIAPPQGLVGAIEASTGVAHREEEEQITFWRAVRADPGTLTTEELYFFPGPLARGDSEEVLGYVGVTLSKARLRSGLRTIVARSVAAGLVFLLLGSVSTYLVVRGATRPLRCLVAEVGRRGVSTASRGDLGVLSDSFSELIETLDRAFTTIDELRLGLEQKVEERTAQLSESNRNLQAEIRERARVEEELKRAREDLELRVSQRTAELEAAYKKLLHSEKLSALGTLTASIAHELNNPLFAIRGVLETVQTGTGLGSRELRLVTLAIQECDRISRLIRGLQDFYRPTNDTMAELDVHEIIDSVLLLCRKDLLARDIRVETRHGPDLPRVSGVGDQIKQVILNLIGNARDAMADGGTVVIGTEVRDGWVRIRVEDTGKGIPEEDLDRIFEPFFSTKSAARGTGLGLSISHGIVKRHGGHIEVTSRVGQGTRFTVVLPAGRPPVKEEDDPVDG
ncbi:MAG: hypothetical protein Kow0092_29570 [Deferrisomatales bacterium]